jgi:energy-converting hydrogenase Eha subunit G
MTSDHRQAIVVGLIIGILSLLAILADNNRKSPKDK